MIFELDFCLFRTGFLQATQAVKTKSKAKFKNQLHELEISKIKCRSRGALCIENKIEAETETETDNSLFLTPQVFSPSAASKIQRIQFWSS